ncbi:hypothetical protein FG152_18005 [Ochrobactrum sp. XJ1]|nr:hypothetical protein [Ochrobactrum sp. XJ1]
MTHSASTSWKALAVLAMIFIQIISGSLCSTPVTDRTFVPSSVAAAMQERGSPAENRALLVSDADHHVRYEQRCPQSEIDDLRFSEGLRYSMSADVLRGNQIYPIARPPKILS